MLLYANVTYSFIRVSVVKKNAKETTTTKRGHNSSSQSPLTMVLLFDLKQPLTPWKVTDDFNGVCSITSVEVMAHSFWRAYSYLQQPRRSRQKARLGSLLEWFPSSVIQRK